MAFRGSNSTTEDLYSSFRDWHEEAFGLMLNSKPKPKQPKTEIPHPPEEWVVPRLTFHPSAL